MTPQRGTVPEAELQDDSIDDRWARRYGRHLVALYRLECALPEDFDEIAAQIAARRSRKERDDALAAEIEDLLIF